MCVCREVGEKKETLDALLRGLARNVDGYNSPVIWLDDTHAMTRVHGFNHRWHMEKGRMAGLEKDKCLRNMPALRS